MLRIRSRADIGMFVSMVHHCIYSLYKLNTADSLLAFPGVTGATGSPGSTGQAGSNGATGSTGYTGAGGVFPQLILLLHFRIPWEPLEATRSFGSLLLPDLISVLSTHSVKNFPILSFLLDECMHVVDWSQCDMRFQHASTFASAVAHA